MHSKETGFFRRAIRSLRDFINFLEVCGVLFMKEKRYSSSLPVASRIRAWRLGFLSDSYAQYFPNGDQDHSLYLSDYQRWRTVPKINAKYGIVLADKLLFSQFFKPFSEHLPDVFFLIRSTNLFTPALKAQSWKSLFNVLETQRKLVLKPRSGFGGRGIFVLSAAGDKFQVNGKCHSKEQLVDLAVKLDNYLVTQYIRQDGYAHDIFPDAVNTLRILTFIDPDTYEARIGGIAHRFGSRTTGPVDNWTSGGMSAAVNPHSGTLGKCAQNPQGKQIIWLTAHPDTEHPISGLTIPNWHLLTTRILEIANYCKFCPYIGWDVAVCKENFWILEANDSPDIHILQIHEPLLKSAENRSFYRFYGIK